MWSSAKAFDFLKCESNINSTLLSFNYLNFAWVYEMGSCIYNLVHYKTDTKHTLAGQL